MGVKLGLLFGIIVCSTILTGRVRRYAIRHQLLDKPNYRSSHARPTPRGGGVAVVVVFLLALGYLLLSDQVTLKEFLALGAGGAFVAGMGYLDDHYDLSPLLRLLGHFAVAVWAVVWTGGIPQLDLGFATWDWGWVGHIVSVIGVVWMLNLYNFMDGIDGIAASEAVFVAGVGGLLLMHEGADGLALASLALAAACMGFLFWNWPPAKIFMGDVCSGFLGYVLAVLMIVSNHKTDVSLWVWLLLLGVFVIDATITVIRRLLRREKVYEAHRSHAYQQVTIRLQSHLKVTRGVIGINVLLLAPLALWVWQTPDLAVPITAVTFLILAGTALQLGAGVADEQNNGGIVVPETNNQAKINADSLQS